MADVNVTRRTGTIATNDLFILKTCVPDGDRRSVVVIGFTRVAAFGGNVTLMCRPKGSSAAWQAKNYVLEATGATSAAAIGAADATIRIENTGVELALQAAATGVGSLDYVIHESPDQ